MDGTAVGAGALVDTGRAVVDTGAAVVVVDTGAADVVIDTGAVVVVIGAGAVVDSGAAVFTGVVLVVVDRGAVDPVVGAGAVVAVIGTDAEVETGGGAVVETGGGAVVAVVDGRVVDAVVAVVDADAGSPVAGAVADVVTPGIVVVVSVVAMDDPGGATGVPSGAGGLNAVVVEPAAGLAAGGVPPVSGTVVGSAVSGRVAVVVGRRRRPGRGISRSSTDRMRAMVEVAPTGSGRSPAFTVGSGAPRPAAMSAPRSEGDTRTAPSAATATSSTDTAVSWLR